MGISFLTSHRFLALFLSILCFLLSYSPVTNTLDNNIYNIFSRLVPLRTDNSDVVVIDISATSGDQADAKSMSKNQIEPVLNYLKKSKVKTIGLHLLIREENSSQDLQDIRKIVASMSRKDRNKLLPLLNDMDIDRRIGSLITDIDHLVLLEEIEDMPDAGHLDLPDAIKSVEYSGESTWRFNSIIRYLFVPPENNTTVAGVAGAQGSIPGIPRGYRYQNANRQLLVSEPLLYKINNRYLTSFPLMVAATAQRIDPDDIVVVIGGGVKLGFAMVRAGPGFQYYPKPSLHGEETKRIKVFSSGDVLSGRVSRPELHGKIVLVGNAHGSHSPLLKTTASIYLSPVEWSANIVDSLLTGQSVSVPYWEYALQRVLIIALMIYFLLVPGRLRGGLGISVSLATAFILINASLLILLVSAVWVSFVLPALFMVIGHLLLFFRHRIESVFHKLHIESSKAYRELALNMQSQGRLDQSFEYFCKCTLLDEILEPLYYLGLDFERRRQYSKALSVYDHIASHNKHFRDIETRRKKLDVGAQKLSATTTGNITSAATLLLDDNDVAKPVLGRYQLQRELGHGAMGVVYLGKDPKIGRTVAIKTMALSKEFESTQLDDIRRRFYQEAETAGQLSHPHIITIYDAGEEHDLAYIAMDYIQGDSLGKFVRPDGLLPIKDVFDIGIKVARALDYAHNQKVVHRDVKPANIMYDGDNGVLKVMDFGIACLTDNSKTRTGTVLGSPFYMSPEQLAGRKVDGRSDLYSLGVTLYQLFTGSLPFDGDSMANLMYKISNEKAKSIRKLRPDLPACLVRIINKSIEKSPDSRYQSGAEMAEALQQCSPAMKTNGKRSGG